VSANATLDIHLSTLGASGLLGAATHGVGVDRKLTKGKAKVVPMSAAVLEAARNVAAELQLLQDEYLANTYKTQDPPKTSRFITQSWGQMSVLSTIMDHLEADPHSSRAPPRESTQPVGLKLDPIPGHAPLVDDWNDLLKRNKWSAKIDVERRSAKESVRNSAASIIQKCWKSYRVMKVIANARVRQRKAVKKDDWMDITKKTYDEYHFNGSSLIFMPSSTASRVKERRKEQEKHGCNLLAGWEAVVPGERSPIPQPPKKALALPPISNESSPSPQPTAAIQTSASSVRPRAYSRLPSLKPNNAGAQGKTRAGGASPRKAALIKSSRRHASAAALSSPRSSAKGITLHTSTAQHERQRSSSTVMMEKVREPSCSPIPVALSAPPRATNAPTSWESGGKTVSGISQVQKTGLWKKSRARAANLVLGADSEISPMSMQEANRSRWQDAAYRTHRLNQVATKFMKFDKALSEWTESKEQKFTEQDMDGANAPADVQEAGEFLLAATTMWRIMRGNLQNARKEILTRSAKASKHQGVTQSSKRSILDVVTSDEPSESMKVHYQLSKECQPISVALGKLSTMIMIQRSVRQAKRARERVASHAETRQSYSTAAARPPATRKPVGTARGAKSKLPVTSRFPGTRI